MSSRHALQASAAAAFVAAALAAPAGAEISGPCAASINGENVATRSTGANSSAIVVSRHSQVPVSMSAGKPITHLKVQISFAGIPWTVHDEPTTGRSWSKTVNVDKYAKYGVGLYRVSGSSSGPGLDCSGAALVKVKGNPIATVAGGTALALGLLSVAGLVLIGLKGGGGALPMVGGLVLGLIGGLAAAVLLQQFSVLYPTRTVAIVFLAGGAVIGLVVGGLGHVRAKPASAAAPLGSVHG